MSHKTNAVAVRLKLNRSSDSLWFSDYNFKKNLRIDLETHVFLKNQSSFSKYVLPRLFLQILPKKINGFPFFFLQKKKKNLDF